MRPIFYSVQTAWHRHSHLSIGSLSRQDKGEFIEFIGSES